MTLGNYLVTSSIYPLVFLCLLGERCPNTHILGGFHPSVTSFHEFSKRDVIVCVFTRMNLAHKVRFSCLIPVGIWEQPTIR